MQSTVNRRVRQRRRMAGLAVVGALLAAGCSANGGGSTGAASPPLPGITATTVDVGFTITDIGDVAKGLGFVRPDYGGIEGQRKAILAVTDYINKNGGMGGRQVKPVIKIYNGSTDSPEQSAAQCNGLTQDDKVVGVVLDGGYQNNTIPCFAAARTLVIAENLVAQDQAAFEEYSPYLWSPTHPEYSSFVRAQLTAMNEAKYFDGNTGVLVMPVDGDVSRRTTDTVVKPFLSSIGVTNVQTKYVDSTNTGTLGATAAEALNAGKNAKLNKVIVIGGARIQPVALSDQAATGYPSEWAISTYDNPIFTQNNPESVVTELRNGMVGLGYAPAQDVDQAQAPAFPDPTNPAQQKCYDIISAAGGTPPGNLRSNWRTALQYCDGAMFLKAAFDSVPNSATVTGAEFKDAVAKIGTSYASSITFGSQWGPGVYAGTNAAKALSWDSSCECFTYTGEIVKFGAPAGAAPAPAPSVATSVVPYATITAGSGS